MGTAYHSFDLHLKQQPGNAGSKQVQVSATYIDRQDPQGQKITVQGQPTPYSEGDLSLLMRGNMNVFVPPEELEAPGQKVADLLLPPGPVRDEFMGFWNERKRVRLRLFYPKQNFQELLRIPWEYAYLGVPANGGSNIECLGRNENISIAHCLEEIPDDARPSAKASLMVRIAYLSWPGQTPVDEFDSLWNEFASELQVEGRAQSIFECTTVSPQADPPDVYRAFEDDHFVHIICHGSPDSIKLEDEDLNTCELVEYFKSKLQLGQAQTLPDTLKAILLLSCSGAAGPGCVAHLLHRLGVPVVIGMTQWIEIEHVKNFVKGFYGALFSPPDNCVERALIKGRVATYQMKGGRWYAGFGLPRLYLFGKDSTLTPQDLLFGCGDMVDRFDDHRQSIMNEASAVQRGAVAAAAEEDERRLQAWVDGDESLSEDERKKKWYWVIRPPGFGKTTLITQLVNRLVERKKPPCIYHFCTKELSGTGDRLKFVCDSLVPQIRKYCGEENYSGWCHPGKFPLLVRNADQALDYFVIEPLRNAKDNGKPSPLIVVDAIDFVPPNENKWNSILNLLLRHRDDLDDVARFLITTDKDTEAQSLTLRRPDLIPEFLRSGLVGIIGDKRVQDLESVLTGQLPILKKPPLRSLPPRVQKKSPIQILQNVVVDEMPQDRSTPLPIYVQIEKRLKDHSADIVPVISEELTSSMEGLYALCRRSLGKIEKSQSPMQIGRIGQILDVLAVAYESLAPDVIAWMIGLSPTDGEMAKLVDQIQPFLKTSAVHEGKLALYHVGIKKPVLDRPDRPQGTAAAHELLVKAYRPRGGDWAQIADWSKLSVGELSEEVSQEASRYARRYLASHAYECYQATEPQDKARHGRADDFLNLVCTPCFRTVRLIEMGLQIAVEDVRRALRVAFVEYGLLAGIEAAQTLAAFDRVLAVMSADDSALVEFEKTLRRENRGIPELLDFLDLSS